MENCTALFEQAQTAAKQLAQLESSAIQRVLNAVADRILEQSASLLEANAQDLTRMAPDDPRYDRLKLTEERLAGIAHDMRNVASLPSPLGLTLDQTTRPNGMTITKVSVPFGVIGIIYEARPNVGFDCFALCFKSGNAVILKGGTDALCSNQAIVALIRDTLSAHNIDPNTVQLLPADHAATTEMLGAELPPNVVEYIASSITNNVRQLEGAVKKIFAKHSLMGRAIDMTLAEECIRDIFKASPGLKPTPELILEETANFYNITTERILGSAKTKDVVVPRQVAMYLIREMTDLSFPEIGRFMGRDHTTVLHAINKTQVQIEKDESFSAALSDLKKNIQNR